MPDYFIFRMLNGNNLGQFPVRWILAAGQTTIPKVLACQALMLAKALQVFDSGA
ncbi:MAG TPA: hypothetical protein PLI53_03495 [Geobacteraceae bacterium]|nr:hypothetical protein [Geobacteraceae bacterium]